MKGNALIHAIKYLLHIDEPHSQTTLLEKKAIAKYAKSAQLSVEIGVYEGVNTVNIAKNISSDGKVYAIDPFFKGQLGISYGKIITFSYVKRNNVHKKVVFIEKFSHEAVYGVPDKIDFIFVDGDHSLEGIKKDWADWSTKIKIGGIIALHDTSVPTHDQSISQLGSYQYFNSMIIKDKRFELIETIDSLNVLKRIL